jgi:hypothetical protein
MVQVRRSGETARLANALGDPTRPPGNARSPTEIDGTAQIRGWADVVVTRHPDTVVANV